MDTDKVFIFIIWNMSFRYFVKSIEFVSRCYHIFIANIYLEPVVCCGFDYLFLISSLNQVLFQMFMCI